VTEIPPPREALTDNLKAIFENIDRGLVDFGEHNRLWLPLITFLLAQLDRFVEALTKALAQPIPPPSPAREPMLTAPAKPPRPRKPAPLRLKFGWLLDLMPGASTTEFAIAQPVEIPTDLPDPPASIAPADPEPGPSRLRRSIRPVPGTEPPADIRIHDQPNSERHLKPPNRKITKTPERINTPISLRYSNKKSAFAQRHPSHHITRHAIVTRRPASITRPSHHRNGPHRPLRLSETP
jgi:hypothetical protein